MAGDEGPAPRWPDRGETRVDHLDYIDRLERLEHHIRSDRFAEFTRGALQDNIILCDQKSGILLAFGSAMILFCVQAFGEPALKTEWAEGAHNGLMLLATVGFVGSCYYALMSVAPRIRKAPDDHIFWGSKAYDSTVEEYIARYRDADPNEEMSDKLRHLHTLAGICRDKYAGFKHALRFALISFLPLILAEVVRVMR